ncbi:unnamed protein product, partial [Ranitomeya imitator]
MEIPSIFVDRLSPSSGLLGICDLMYLHTEQLSNDHDQRYDLAVIIASRAALLMLAMIPAAIIPSNALRTMTSRSRETTTSSGHFAMHCWEWELPGSSRASVTLRGTPEGNIGGLSTALQNAADKPLMPTVRHVILSLTDCPPCYSLPQTVLRVILSLTDCPPCYSLPHRLSSMLFSPSQTVRACYSLPHRLSAVLFSPSQTVLRTILHVILSLPDYPPCYSLPPRLSSMLFSPSQTILHVILSLTDCPPCYCLPHTLTSVLFSPSHTVLRVILALIHCPPCYSLPHRLSSILVTKPEGFHSTSK